MPTLHISNCNKRRYVGKKFVVRLREHRFRPRGVSLFARLTRVLSRDCFEYKC